MMRVLRHLQRFFVGLALLAVWAPGAAAIPFTIIGFNLDGDDVEWKFLSMQMAQVKDCHVWAVTRVAPEQLSLIIDGATRGAPDRWQTVVAGAGDDRRSFIAVDTSRFGLLEQKTSSPWPDGLSTSAAVLLRTAHDEQDLWVVLLDLSQLAEEERMVEMLNINRWVRQQQMPVVVVGGFVDAPESVPFSMLTADGLLRRAPMDDPEPAPCPGATHDDVLLAGGARDWQARRRAMFPSAQYCSFAPDKTSRYRPVRLDLDPALVRPSTTEDLGLSDEARQQILERLLRIEDEVEALRRLLGAAETELR